MSVKIAVWRTGHEIADRVVAYVYRGLQDGKHDVVFWTTDSCQDVLIRKFDLHIGYGILRGMDNVFKACQKAVKPFFHIDRGYWKPGHYDGYYRVSLNGTQQTFGLDKLEPDYERWGALRLEILPFHLRSGEPLCCPPTEYVREFFDCHDWQFDGIVRTKDSQNSLNYDLLNCSKVITFNSSVGWEALRQGIPVVSDPRHSIIGAYEKLMDKALHIDYDARRRLFGIQASLQLTLEEMKQGKLWPLLNRLMSIADGIPAKA